MRSKGNLQSSSEYGGNYYYYYVKLPVLKKSLGMRKNLDQPVSTADWYKNLNCTTYYSVNYASVGGATRHTVVVLCVCVCVSVRCRHSTSHAKN